MSLGWNLLGAPISLHPHLLGAENQEMLPWDSGLYVY